MPLNYKDYNRVSNYVKDPSSISRHSFKPFIHKTITTRKYRANLASALRTKNGERERIKLPPKRREIYYASHIDSMVFSYYNQVISSAYEARLNKEPFNHCITAYRKIPLRAGCTNNKCNIHFAHDVFSFIRRHSNQQLAIIVIDFVKFFDNLDPKILKRNWCSILGVLGLPPDHYNVFKALTRKVSINDKDLFTALNGELLARAPLTKGKLKKKRISALKFAKEKEIVAFCEWKTIVEHHLSLVIKSKRKTGIPQGTALSATLANVYMLEFDAIIYNLVTETGGIYNRYSDDAIIVCPLKDFERLKNEFDKVAGSDKARLTIAEEKTKVYFAQPNERGQVISQVAPVPNAQGIRPLEYLGFSFDGSRVLIKSQGFSKFSRNMKHAIKRAGGFARVSKNPDKRIFKNKLYQRFTYHGKGRKQKWMRKGPNSSEYVKSRYFNWGNYLSYVDLANEVFRDFNDSDFIKRQSRRFWNRFDKLLKNEVAAVKAFHDSKHEIETK